MDQSTKKNSTSAGSVGVIFSLNPPPPVPPPPALKNVRMQDHTRHALQANSERIHLFHCSRSDDRQWNLYCLLASAGFRGFTPTPKIFYTDSSLSAGCLIGNTLWHYKHKKKTKKEEETTKERWKQKNKNKKKKKKDEDEEQTTTTNKQQPASHPAKQTKINKALGIIEFHSADTTEKRVMISLQSAEGAGVVCWQSAGLVMERLRVRIPAGAVEEFSSPGLTLCAYAYSVSVPPPCYRSGTQKTPVILPKVLVAGYTQTRIHPWPNEVGAGWLCRRPGIVWEPIRKRAHTQLVREHAATVVSARWTTVDWPWLKEWN